MNNHPIWIVVAQRAEARVYATEDLSHLQLIEDFKNPEGRLKDYELGGDSPGRTNSGSSRHSYSPRTEPGEQVEIDFSKKVAHFLDDSRTRHQFKSIVLIAGPHFLGRLRKDLSIHTYSCIAKVIEKNLGGLSEQEISLYLKESNLKEDVALQSFSTFC